MKSNCNLFIVVLVCSAASLLPLVVTDDGDNNLSTVVTNDGDNNLSTAVTDDGDNNLSTVVTDGEMIAVTDDDEGMEMKLSPSTEEVNFSDDENLDALPSSGEPFWNFAVDMNPQGEDSSATVSNTNQNSDKYLSNPMTLKSSTPTPSPPQTLTTSQSPTLKTSSATSTQTPDLSTIFKEGALYYDITQAKTTELVIGSNDEGVTGLTATKGGHCLVQTLVVNKGYHLDQDIIRTCRLKKLVLKGKSWLCTMDLSWLMLFGKEMELDYSKAICEDVWCEIEGDLYNNYKLCKFEEGLHLVKQYILRLIDKLLDLLEDQNNLNVLYLSGNDFDSIPYLEDSRFPMLQQIFLQNNKIEELNIDAFTILLKRKKVALELKGNPLRCGCKMHQLFDIFLSFYAPETFPDLKDTVCINETNNEKIPLKYLKYFSDEKCFQGPKFTFDYWSFIITVLSILNFIMIVFIVDLSLILCNFRGIKGSQRPKLDYVVCCGKMMLHYLKVPFLLLCHNGEQQEKEVKDEDMREMEAAAFWNHNRSLMARRRTPRPDTD
ncbi:hypothetical protein Hamer_G021690 [Homarus americanus]|uniref:Uncharacterized protein n=1 Tax=Homarus americanus TaxID=6706 RepID=A0A8J5MUR9_HOMAM|nr:hypothetical protein Hamer_G021690 [Homarus americanus]